MKVSQGKEDYIKAIYKANGSTQFISNKDIANALNVSAPSVSDMLLKMRKEGLVEYVAYQGAKLTKTGHQIAIDVIRKHRLTEVFLYNVLGYALEDLDRDAELLEHIESEEFYERLEVFLEYPKHCPHGSLIPTSAVFQETQNVTLLHHNVNDTVILKRIIDNKQLFQYLAASEIAIGDPLTITHKDDINDVILVQAKDGVKYLSYALAKMIFVESIS